MTIVGEDITMQCRNCGYNGGPKGNKHVKNRRYTCNRPSSSGYGVEPSIAVDSFISDFSECDSGSSYDSGYSGGYNDSGSSNSDC